MHGHKGLLLHVDSHCQCHVDGENTRPLSDQTWDSFLLHRRPLQVEAQASVTCQHLLLLKSCGMYLSNHG